MNLTPITFKLLSLFTILFGLIICFFGYRIFRIVLAILGFVLGASFIAGMGFSLTNGNNIVIILIVGIAGGLIASIALLFLYSAGVFLLGALFGISVFSGILILMNIDISPILYIFPVLIGGITAIFFQKFMIIVTTSIAGGWIVVISTFYLLNSKSNPFSPESINNLSEIEVYRIVVSLLALGVLGFIVQYFFFPKMNQDEGNSNSTEIKHQDEG